MSFQTNVAECPRCTSRLDSATGVRAPKPGDFAVCFYCAEVLVYDDEVKVKKATREDLKRLLPEQCVAIRVFAAGVQAHNLQRAATRVAQRN